MLDRGKGLKIVDSIVERIAVAMVDMTVAPPRSASPLPDVVVKPPSTVGEIPLVGVKPIKSSVPELSDGIKDDRIIEFDRRRSANVHPLSVKNK
jgi:hypothetical protein